MARLLVLVAVAALVAGAMADVAENELSSIPFEAIIAGPLTAVIKAQAMAARTTVQFIESVGFQQDENKKNIATMLEFGYDTVDTAGVEHTGQMKVPLLAVVPIPYLRFESVEVELNVKITETKQNTNSGSFSHTREDSSSKATVSSQWKGTSGETHEYSTKVLVHCSQAEMPAGMTKVLDKLLELAVAGVA